MSSDLIAGEASSDPQQDRDSRINDPSEAVLPVLQLVFPGHQDRRPIGTPRPAPAHDRAEQGHLGAVDRRLPQIPGQPRPQEPAGDGNLSGIIELPPRPRWSCIWWELVDRNNSDGDTCPHWTHHETREQAQAAVTAILEAGGCASQLRD